ncbi:MAG: CoA-binding protein [Chloroflexi bacterium]|nr:CoA-binding protein [Chloroflexota bacterium]
MPSLETMTTDFLAQKRIAVAGITREKDDAANLIYRKLRSTGYQVFAINPNAETFDGEPCYPDVKSTPEKVDAVVIVTRPDVTEQIVQQCAEADIHYVWMHRSMMGNSSSEKAVQFCKEHDINVIAGGCPMMFCAPVDFGHKCMRWMGKLTGSLPKES